jgi:alkylation response protein AidB-like acyl-CoA dehydrogenase
MAHLSDYLLLLATTDPNAEKPSRGKTLFLVDAKQPGVVARPIPKLGMRCVGSCEVQLDNAYVPATHVIGEVNRGWGHILSTLNNERILVAALCTGILRGIIEEAVKYATERVAFGKPIGEFQTINHWIAEMQMGLMQAELVTYKSAWLFDQDLPCGVESSAAKAICSEHATWAADRGIQILGGMGYSAEYQMQRYWRDVRLYQIGPVTNQMVRNIVAESIGLPRAF